MMPPALLACLAAALAGPAMAKEHPANTFAATLPAAAAQPPANGGIFQPATGYAALHEGTRARSIGDALTILLVETTVTTKSVSARNRKSGSAALVPPVTGPFAFLSPDALKASSSSSFNGGGDAGQRSSLATTLSATIAEVRPNGTALIKGEKQMLLSQGQEWVRFSGIVRLADIDVENTVPSSRIADAHIEYSGKGALHRTSRPGWLSRIFNAVSPF